MSAQSNARPIIKRKKIVKADGHHGGAWKVAYADFVTAMMAFFMLMWLLGATTEKQRKGIADYFNPTIPINRISGGGDGAFGGDSVFSEDTMAQSGTGAGMLRPMIERQARGALGSDAETESAAATAPEAAEEADRVLAAVEEALLGQSGESLIRDLLRRHIVTRISDEGLVIELFDTETTPLFTPTGAPGPELRALVPPIVAALALVENPVAVDSHVSRLTSPAADAWERSIGRGSGLRRLLEQADFPPQRIARLTGVADRRPVAPDPAAARNNRIELVVLRDLD
jgi:chemotaxis protein MotB